MKVTDVIEPRIGKIGKWKIGTFDIETRDDINGGSALLGQFIMGATCRDAAGETIVLHNSPLSMLIELLKTQDKVRWFCHNGGNFDFKYIINDAECLDYLKENGYRIDVIGGKIAKGLMIKKAKKVTMLCDSFKLMNGKLAKLAKGFGVPTAKGFIDFDNEDFDENNDSHIQYLRDDVISLWQVVAKYREIIVIEFGCDIKCTASSTAFQAWTTTITGNVYKHNDKCNLFARLSYYGGRTECYFQGVSENVKYIDVNSLYAHIMRECGALHRPYYTDEFNGPGFYRVSCKVPLGLKFGPLPFRKPDGTGVLFPIGTFDTYASSVEIDVALECGCDVKIHEGYAFDKHDTDIFKAFIDKCIYLRQKDYNGALGMAAKFLQNNLYGFFGMSPLRSELIFAFEEPAEGNYSPVVDTRTGEQIMNLWERDTIQDTVNCIPAFAAWITANARVHLLRAMMAEEKAGNTVLYCDTDSILMLGTPTSRIADGEYGAFKLEYTFDRLETITGKTYRGVTGTTEVMRCKGLPAKKMQTDFYRQALLGMSPVATYTQLYSLSRVAKNGILGKDNAERHMPNIHSMGTRRPGSDGFTLPMILQQSVLR